MQQQPVAVQLSTKQQMVLRAIVLLPVTLQINLVRESRMIQRAYRFFTDSGLSPIDAQGCLRSLQSFMRSSSTTRERMFENLLTNGLLEYVNRNALDERFFEPYRAYAVSVPQYAQQMFEILVKNDEILGAIESHSALQRDAVTKVLTEPSSVENYLRSTSSLDLKALLRANMPAVMQIIAANPTYVAHVVFRSAVHQFNQAELSDIFLCME